jgi:8-oxo-dGTP diphosphatase
VFGAAGVVFVHAGAGDVHVLLQHRSQWSHQGGTWSCPGGALDEGEPSLEAALREAWEEVGAIPAGEEIGQYVFAPATDWSYTTHVVSVSARFATDPNFESEAIDWIHLDAVSSLPLHPGFATAWPHVEAIIRGS